MLGAKSLYYPLLGPRPLGLEELKITVTYVCRLVEIT